MEKNLPKISGHSRKLWWLYQNIYEHLCLGQPLETHAQDILNVIRIIEAAYQSHRENKIVNLK